jgi:protocatechuate 3,4-dioxygenase beta subunit
VRVDATVWSHEPTARHATARLAIDRTKWGITFRGGVLTNDLIDDTVRLELEIVARVRRAAAGAASAHVVRPSPGSVRTTLASARTAQAAPAPADAPRTAAAQARREPVIGEPCEGCEGIFDGRPTAPPPIARLAPIGEPGAPLLLHGTVRDTTGRPVPGTIVYAYHTNARGIYPLDDLMRGRAAYHHGTLRGWARTDGAGRYAFETIRPAHYPRTTLPEHVHLHVIEPGRCTYYIDDVMFTDDPHLTPAQRRQLVAGRGGSGVVRPVRDASGRWVAVRDIVLGQGIPGYERCDRR